MKTLIINIKQLVQVEEEPRKWVAGADMAKLGIIDDAYLLINEDKIEAFGKMNELNQDAIYEGTLAYWSITRASTLRMIPSSASNFVKLALSMLSSRIP